MKENKAAADQKPATIAAALSVEVSDLLED